MIHSKILSIYNELELFVQNLFHGIEKLDTIHRELAQRRENLTGAAADAE